MLRRRSLALLLGLELVFGGCTPAKVRARCPGDEVETPKELATGGRIVWRSEGSVGPCIGIYSMRADGTRIRRLTRFAFEYFYIPDGPAQSPDGRLISFIGQCDDEMKPEPDLCVMKSDGSGGRTVAASNLQAVIDLRDHPAWSPDGTRLAFVRSPASANDATRSVHVIGIDGTCPWP